MIAGKDYFKWCAYPLRLSVSKFESFDRYEHDCVCILEDQGNSLDLLFFNFLKAAQCKSFLVCFTAAVTKRRAHAKPPFFSGLGIAKSLGMPLLAIADPSLDLDNSLDLAWYIGSQRFANLQQLISSVITSVANKSSLNPILVGGSGGGFAALVQLLLRTNSDALVFNPQTDILKYHFKSIEKMMTVCFGSKPHTTSTPQKTNLDKINSWRQILESNNIISSVCGKDISAKGRLVYLQNSSDWHKTRFMLPFMRSLALTPNQDSKEFKVEYNNISFICGGWGEGHVVPPKELILAHINDLAVSHLTSEEEPSRIPCINSLKVAATSSDMNRITPLPFQSKSYHLNAETSHPYCPRSFKAKSIPRYSKDAPLSEILPVSFPHKWVERGYPFNSHSLMLSVGIIVNTNLWSSECKQDFFGRVISLINNHIEISGDRAWILSRLPHRHHGVPLPEPWASALSNAKIMTTLNLIHEYRNNLGADLLSARLLKAFVPIELPQGCSQKWISMVDPSGYLWFEEYPIDNMVSHVLSGHIAVLTSLYFYWQITQDRLARHLLEAGMLTIEKNIHRFRVPGSINRYDLWNGYVPDYAPKRAVIQQLFLFRISGEETFLRYARIFAADNNINGIDLS